MVSFEHLRSELAKQGQNSAEYQTAANIDLYDSPDLSSLATQALEGRHLHFGQGSSVPLEAPATLSVSLCEDGYPGWIAVGDLSLVEATTAIYHPRMLTAEEIQARLPAVIAFTKAAMAQPNVYLWGGTVGPNYDCSGLVQRAFAEQGIWLPRDAYQQEAFTQPISNPGEMPATLVDVLQPGDLIFFGPAEKATHVALYVGDGHYIHSSGQDQGRNGIGIDRLSEQGDRVSRNYYYQVRGAGRVVSNYQPPQYR